MFTYKPDHPKATTSITLGIIALFILLSFFCCGPLVLVSLVMGIIAIVEGNNVEKDNKEYPDKYSQESIQNAQTGKILGIIATVVSGIMMLVGILLFILYGTVMYFDLMKDL